MTPKEQPKSTEKQALLRVKNLFAGQREPEEDPEITRLRQDLRETNQQLHTAYANFNAVTDQESIAYYTYLIKAFEIKYGSLLRKAKERNLDVSRLDDNPEQPSLPQEG